MRKILGALLVICLTFAALPANAGGNVYHHHHRGNNNGAIVGGIIGGMIIGSILTAPRYENRSYEYYEDEYPVTYCRRYFRGYDYYGNPVYVRRCR